MPRPFGLSSVAWKSSRTRLSTAKTERRCSRSYVRTKPTTRRGSSSTAVSTGSPCLVESQATDALAMAKTHRLFAQQARLPAAGSGGTGNRPELGFLMETIRTNEGFERDDPRREQRPD